jgi:hypothetical protein
LALRSKSSAGIIEGSSSIFGADDGADADDDGDDAWLAIDALLARFGREAAALAAGAAFGT